MYKAVFLDLDGTLLDDNKNISQENYDAIKYVLQQDGLVILASGRPLSTTKKYWDKLNISRYIIYSNGTGIFDTQTNETIFSAIIESDICLTLYNYSSQNNLCIRFDTSYGRYITNMEYGLSSDIFFNEDIYKFLNENDILQVSFLSETKEAIDNIINYINQLNKREIKIENIFITRGKIGNLHAINIINSNASKGNAIYGLCKFLKIDIKDVIAIGDDLNDISMIKTVGLGVAMENAKPEVKKWAKEITTDNNNSGVAKILREKF